MAHDIIVVGASAGGVDALSQLVRFLPRDLAAAIFVAVHFPAEATSVMPDILNRAGTLRAVHPQDGQAIERGRIYVAPPNAHLMLRQGFINLSAGPRENGHRPAVDPMFRSAARWYGSRVVGVVLSGTMDDGTAGLGAIAALGGVTVAQDPEEAMFPGMPQSAIQNVPVNHILPIKAIADLLAQLATGPEKTREGPIMPDGIDLEVRIDELDSEALRGDDRPGTPANLGCPSCGGTLWELKDGDLIRFRCRVGHGWTADTLLLEQSEALETALWSAFRALKENVSLSRRMSERARKMGHPLTAERFDLQAREAEERAETIRRVLVVPMIAPTLEPVSSPS